MNGNDRFAAPAIILVLILVLSPAGAARTIYVGNDAPADFGTIQAAIDDANNGDTVIVKPGTYVGPGNRDIDFKGKAITVTGTDPNDWDVVRHTVIDCQGTQKEPHRGFLFTTGEGPNSVLSGVKITGGFAPSIPLEIYKKTVGGGICCNKSSPSILRCIVSDNFADQGGGGLFAYNSNPTIRHCEFPSNISSGGGGAIDVWGGRVTLASCSVTGNCGYHGGGINGWAATLLLDNCLIRHNESQSWGAAMCVQSSVQSIIVNCTIIDNCNQGGSPAVEFVNGPGPTRLANCIVWGNSGGGIRSLHTQMDLGYKDRADYCCIEGWDGTWAGVGSFGKDPLLTRDAHLRFDSPCVNAGDPNSLGIQDSRDMDGEMRVCWARVDIGCDELTDADGDDLADAWERRYFADLASTAGIDNPDGDVWNNRSEYIRSSNPLHPPTAYYVDPVRGNDGWDGLSVSWDGSHGPKATIRAAMDQAQARDLDRIVLTVGVYTGEGNRNIDFDGKEVTVRSVDPNDPALVAATVIDCNGIHPLNIDPYASSAGSALVQDRLTTATARRAFMLHSGEGAEASIEGLTMINGSVGSSAGAVLCDWSSPRIINCVLRNNESAYSGGAIYCRNGDPAIERCTLEENRTRYGGAITCSSVDGHITIVNCTIRGNVALISGGGLSCSSGTQVVGCLIAANEARGQSSSSRYPVGGGGVMLGGDGIVLANCTISGNTARQGSGLASGCVDDSQGLATFYNCIVWGNSGGEENQIMFSGCCYNCERSSEPVAIRARHSCIQGPGKPPADDYHTPLTYIEDANCIHVDPRFVSPETGDYRLRADSPCIDAGTNSLPVPLAATDLAGAARLVDFDGDGIAEVDMGAYESSPSGDVFLIPSSRSIRFHAYDSAPLPQPQMLVIGHSGLGSLPWTIDCNCPWLEVSPASGQTGAEITMRANGEGLLPGTYDCRLSVQSLGAANSPLVIPVELQIGRTLRVPGSYTTIQTAVDAAGSGDMIVLADGTYAGPGNREIVLPAKSLWIRSERGPQSCIIDCKDAKGITHSGFTMSKAGSDVICEGLTLSDAGYAFRIRSGRMRLVNCHAVSCKFGCDAADSHVFVEACRFSDGDAAVNVAACDVRILDSVATRNGVGMDFRSSQVVISNTEISQSTVRGISMSSCFDVVLDHCLITGNGTNSYSYQALDFYNTLPTLRNCTIVGNTNSRDRIGSLPPIPADAEKAGWVVNCILWNDRYVAETVLPQCLVQFSDIQGGWPGEGNIDVNPLFASGGYWDTTANRSGGSWVDGDCHLKSQAGRWEPGGGTWVIDDVTSPCIDAGDPNSPVGDEPQPNGGRINMGAYGGTAEASKSYPGG